MNETLLTIECYDCIEDGHDTALMLYFGTDVEGKRWYMCRCCHSTEFVMSDTSARVSV